MKTQLFTFAAGVLAADVIQGAAASIGTGTPASTVPAVPSKPMGTGAMGNTPMMNGASTPAAN